MNEEERRDLRWAFAWLGLSIVAVSCAAFMLLQGHDTPGRVLAVVGLLAALSGVRIVLKWLR